MRINSRRDGLNGKRRWQRPGFTLVELLASLAIIGVLLAVTISAVGMAREASRRAECINRLRQLVLAVHQFEGAYREFPQADTGRDIRPGHSYSSGFWRLLPYLGHETLSKEVRHIGFQGAGHPTTERMYPTTRVRLDHFLCPSDSVDEGTNYRFNGGSNPSCVPLPTLPPALMPNGPFGLMMETGFSDVRDGTSSTIAFSERLKAPTGSGYDHRAHIWGSRLRGQFELAEINHELLYSLGSELGTSEPSSYTPLAGRSWHGGGKHFTIYDHVFLPNAPMPAISSGSSTSNIPQSTGAVPPTSRHSGGVNAAVLDGSVRFISNSIELEVWRSVGSMKGRR